MKRFIKISILGILGFASGASLEGVDKNNKQTDNVPYAIAKQCYSVPKTIHEAAHRGDLPRIQELVGEKGIDVNEVNPKDGEIALHVAAFKGHLNVITWLINNGSVVDKEDSKGRTPLDLASLNGKANAVGLLLDKGATVNHQNKEGNTGLSAAAIGGHRDVVELLLKRGAAVNHQDGEGKTALMLAALKGHRPTVELLLDRGATVNLQNNKGETALSAAAIGGYRSTVELLLDKGATVNHQDGEGKTALMLAALKGHRPTVELLLDRGATVNLQNNKGETALSAAAIGGYRSTVELLLDKGATVNHQDGEGKTALMLAALEGHTSTVELLLNRRADTSLLNERGQTVLDIAVKRKNYEIVELLRNYDSRTPRELSQQQVQEREAQTSVSSTRGKSRAALRKAKRKSKVGSSNTSASLSRWGSKSEKCAQQEPFKAENAQVPDVDLDLSSLSDALQAEEEQVLRTQNNVQKQEEPRANPESTAIAEAFMRMNVDLLEKIQLTQSMLKGLIVDQVAELIRKDLEGEELKQKREMFIRKLLAKGLSVNARDKAGTRLLILAIRAHRNDVVGLFMEQKEINLLLTDANNVNPLQAALEVGNGRAARLIVEALSKLSEAKKKKLLPVNAVERAARLENTEERRAIVIWLLRAGTQPTPGAAREALAQGDIDLAQIIAAYDTPNKNLYEAVLRGDRNAAIRALRQGAQVNNIVNEDGDTVIHIAARNGNRDLVQLLLEWQANTQLTNSQGQTPFNVAQDAQIGSMIVRHEAIQRNRENSWFYRFLNQVIPGSR